MTEKIDESTKKKGSTSKTVEKTPTNANHFTTATTQSKSQHSAKTAATPPASAGPNKPKLGASSTLPVKNGRESGGQKTNAPGAFRSTITPKVYGASKGATQKPVNKGRKPAATSLPPVQKPVQKKMRVVLKKRPLDGSRPPNRNATGNRPYTAGRPASGSGGQSGYGARSGSGQSGYSGGSGGGQSGYGARSGGSGGQSGGYGARSGGGSGGQTGYGARSGGQSGYSGGGGQSGGYGARSGGQTGGYSGGGQSGGYGARSGGGSGGGGQSGGYGARSGSGQTGGGSGSGQTGGYGARSGGGQSGGYGARSGGGSGGSGQSGGYGARSGGQSGGYGGGGGQTGYGARSGGGQSGYSGGGQTGISARSGGGQAPHLRSDQPGGREGGGTTPLPEGKKGEQRPSSHERDRNQGPGRRGPGGGQRPYPPRGGRGGGGGMSGRGPRREYNYKEFVERRKKEEGGDRHGRAGSMASVRMANPVPKSINIIEGMTVNELARKMNLKGSGLVSKLLAMGITTGLNEKIDADTTVLLASEYECEVKFISLYDETELPNIAEEELIINPRSPVVTVMGHVDHGKTTLLDTIRKSNVTDSESGGITQHIAAYQITNKEQKITFIDTPGHEAFTLMRARGAHSTDIVVLVVAADDGLMPQTKEAIDHAKEAKVPIIVAINKTDLESSNIEQAKKQLSDYGLVPEEWGGEAICCPISALKGDGVSDLLDAVLVRAEELELKAPINGRAEGKILESRIDHGRGIVCTLLVQRGVLKTGDNFIAGIYMGKVRAMFNDAGQKIENAGPSTPVEVLGFNEIPNAGDPFQVASSEKEARAVGERRQELKKVKSIKAVKKIDIDNIYSSLAHQAQDSYKIILKGDVDGSVEAIKASIERLHSDEVRVEVILSAVGDINSNDVLLASASNAIIIGFHVRPSTSIQRLADQEGVKIKRYTIIYKVLEEMEEYLLGLRKPEYAEVKIGEGEVRSIFSLSRVGTIAGSFISKGKIKRNCTIELFRNNKQVHRGQISGLKRFKDDAKEVDAGYECGITVHNFNEIKEGDTFTVIEEQEVK